MNQYERIQAQLRAMIESDMTQKDISAISGISQSHISKLLSARKGIEALKRMELSTLFKLFPDLQLEFGGGGYMIGEIHHNTNSPVIQGDGNTVGTALGETAEAFLKRIMESDEIDAETKVKIYKMVYR